MAYSKLTKFGSEVHTVRNVTLLLVEAGGLGFAEVLHTNLHAAVSEGSEPCFRAHGFDVSARKLVFAHDELLKIDITVHVHLRSVDGEDLALSLLIRERELDLAINTSWSDKSGIERFDSVGGHDYLHVRSGVETIELVEQLKHSSLDFFLTT